MSKVITTSVQPPDQNPDVEEHHARSVAIVDPVRALALNIAMRMFFLSTDALCHHASQQAGTGFFSGKPFQSYLWP
jgi:hypothetical protein